MRMISLLCAIALPALIIGCFQLSGTQTGTGPAQEGEAIRLPAPSHDSSTSVEQALSGRRSAREYRDEPLSLSDVSQLLWAAQGLSGTEGLRTAPSAGALYPLEIYVVAGNVRELRPGVYRYVPREHAIVLVADGDMRADLSRAALGQPSVKAAPVDLVIAGVYERATGKYNAPVHDKLTGAEYPAGVKYVHMEAGHASQNVYLQCESLGLGTVAIGAFSEEEVRSIAGMPGEERPLYIMPAGRT